MRADSAWDSLSDDRLLLTMRKAVCSEQQSLADFLQGLVRVEERAIHLQLGYPNLFEFCRQEFGLSEGSIYRRLQVARKLRDYPELWDALRAGYLNLTLASLLCPYLGSVPWDRLLPLVQGKSKREALKALKDQGGGVAPEKDLGRFTPQVRYLGDELYAYRLKIPAKLHHELERTREILSHRIPEGSWPEILSILVDQYLEQHDPQRKLPIPEDSWKNYQSRNRYIPRGLKQKLLAEAEFCCQYVSPEGKRCSQTRYLDVDHIHPISLGGLTEWNNLQILCRNHNSWKGTNTYHNQEESSCMGQFKTGNIKDKWLKHFDKKKKLNSL